MALGENAETSLRDDLAKGLEAIEAAAAPQGDETPAPEAEANVEPAESQTDRGDGRDAHGRFIPKAKDGSEQPEGTDSSQASEHKSADQQQADQSEAQPSPEATGEQDAPPKSWRADEAQAWKDLPATAKAAILRREGEAAKLAGANDAERMFGREMADIFRPVMSEIQAAGASPQMAVKVLLDNHNALRSNDPQVRLAKARQLMAQYGIPPEALIDQNAPQDPHVRSLQQEIESLKSQMQRPAANQQYAPLPPAQDEVNVQLEIERFRADPAHPHFDAVGPIMGKLLEAGAASDLEAAYQMAVAADPALRFTAAPAPAANPQEKTAAARRASASVTGSPGPAGNPAPMSLRDEIAENMRKAGML